MLCAVTLFLLSSRRISSVRQCQKPDGVVAAERQPVERVGIAAGAVRRMHRFPVAVAVAVPGAAQGFDGAVFCFQPLAEFGLGGPAKALLHVPLVPHVVAQSGGLIAISLDQRGQELPGLRPGHRHYPDKGARCWLRCCRQPTGKLSEPSLLIWRAWGYLSHIHSGAPLMISAMTTLMWFWPSSSTIRS